MDSLVLLTKKEKYIPLMSDIEEINLYTQNTDGYPETSVSVVED